MRTQRSGKWFIRVTLVILVGWPLYQLYSLIDARMDREDAAKLIYQISVFQMDLLHKAAADSERVQTTDQLNGLRQAIYTADFTHQRLVLAFGKDKITGLDCLSDWMNLLLRLQVSGSRELRKSERETIRELSEKFEQMYEAYGELLASDGRVVGSKNGDLKKLDHSISELCRKRLMKLE